MLSFDIAHHECWKGLALRQDIESNAMASDFRRSSLVFIDAKSMEVFGRARIPLVMAYALVLLMMFAPGFPGRTRLARLDWTPLVAFASTSGRLPLRRDQIEKFRG